MMVILAQNGENSGKYTTRGRLGKTRIDIFEEEFGSERLEVIGNVLKNNLPHFFDKKKIA